MRVESRKLESIRLIKTMKRKIVAVPVLIFILCALAAILPLPWNENAENFFLDLNYNLRGGRDLSARFALVFISQEDIEALGGWPITRDYYGYVAHLLHQRGAKVIGFDLLFAAEDKHHPEFDGMLTHFFQFAGNVCLPMLFQEWERDGDGRHDYGKHPLYPIPSVF
jgi:CHASE2 domain-containing sensor protein